jgi:hypothetical protein
MSAAKYDFQIEQGSSFSMSLVYKDDDGNVIDLTGWCARIVWKTNLNTTQTFTTENLDYTTYKFTIEPELGRLKLLLPADTTNNFGFSTAKYDLELRSDEDLYAGGGKQVLRLLYGTATVIKRFSKSSELLECDS